MSTVIKVEDLSKQYRLGNVGTGSIAHDINRAWYKLRGKEDPYLKIGENNDRTTKGNSEYIWALKDINFEVKQGEVLGIIGRNGAGKSTLLKILSRTTTPTTGSVKIKGRVASLLEVGTGFHPELSGRENIFLNGAIMGMTKQEIKRKFDEIVDFAGVERYIDTPVKRYSSGMYVRLAFGVAAHLEPDILIVDEVLAVGDADFQKKALGKMHDVSEKEGRTVLFVSHNISALQKLCKSGILLINGQINSIGNINNVISEYVDNKIQKKYIASTKKINNNEGFIEVLPIDINGKEKWNFNSGEAWGIKTRIKLLSKTDHFIIGITMKDQLDKILRTTWSPKYQLQEGEYEFSIIEEIVVFSPGKYTIDIAISNFHRNIEYLKLPFTIDINEISVLGKNNDILNFNYGILNNRMVFNFTKL